MIGNYVLGFGGLSRFVISYSLGDAIDWKHSIAEQPGIFAFAVSYSLGDAIDWKHKCVGLGSYPLINLLLARGRD